MAGFVETADRLMEAGHVESSTIQDKKERVAGARNGGRTFTNRTFVHLIFTHRIICPRLTLYCCLSGQYAFLRLNFFFPCVPESIAFFAILGIILLGNLSLLSCIFTCNTTFY